MHVFYVPGIEGENYVLDKQESRHCIRVMRVKKNDPVQLIDGKGNLYDGMVINPDPSGCVIRIRRVTENYGRRPYKLHMAVSPLKNPERFEWFVEKCVEIGVDEITPLICEKSEKKSIRTERINNIIVAAMKQSLKAFHTRLNDPTGFNEMLDVNFSGIRLIAYCSGVYERKALKSVYTGGNNVLFLIGPEGDFTEKEIRRAINKGFVPVHLGDSRLRTETAGVAACHSIYFLNQ